MNIDNLFDPNEKPLENLVDDGGFCGIFRTIGCVGDSLASGEFESMDENGERGYHDFYEYSWGQYMARSIGSKVYNFSQGGMTAKQYCGTWADHWGYFNNDKLCQAYIIALGVNDINQPDIELGDLSDIDLENYKNNKDTFVGAYAQIIQRLKLNQPKARFFLMTIPKGNPDKKGIAAADKHAKLLYGMADLFDYTYVLDFRKYAPVYDKSFTEKFFLGSHMNPMGYMLTAKMVSSYIDYIIRHNMEDFKQIGFIGAPYHNTSAKW